MKSLARLNRQLMRKLQGKTTAHERQKQGQESKEDFRKIARVRRHGVREAKSSPRIDVCKG